MTYNSERAVDGSTDFERRVDYLISRSLLRLRVIILLLLIRFYPNLKKLSKRKVTCHRKYLMLMRLAYFGKGCRIEPT